MKVRVVLTHALHPTFILVLSAWTASSSARLCCAIAAWDAYGREMRALCMLTLTCSASVSVVAEARAARSELASPRATASADCIKAFYRNRLTCSRDTCAVAASAADAAALDWSADILDCSELSVACSRETSEVSDATASVAISLSLVKIAWFCGNFGCSGTTSGRSIVELVCAAIEITRPSGCALGCCCCCCSLVFGW